MSDAILTVLFVGLSWWLWAKTQKWERDDERRTVADIAPQRDRVET